MNLHFTKSTFVAAAALAIAGSANAVTAPTATLNFGSFVEYTGTGPVGNDAINTDLTLFWMYESSGTYLGQAVDSWFVFFDPVLGSIAGTVTFGSDIVHLVVDPSELAATSSFGKPGVVYDFTSKSSGLEDLDKAYTSYSGSTLSLHWQAQNPGDHMRVFTVSAVPEPGTYALMLAGVAAVGAVARRR
jgi:hypothetical protein